MARMVVAWWIVAFLCSAKSNEIHLPSKTGSITGTAEAKARLTASTATITFTSMMTLLMPELPEM